MKEKNRINIWLLVIASSLALCLGTISCTSTKSSNETTSTDASTKPPAQSQTQNPPDFDK